MSIFKEIKIASWFIYIQWAYAIWQVIRDNTFIKVLCFCLPCFLKQGGKKYVITNRGFKVNRSRFNEGDTFHILDHRISINKIYKNERDRNVSDWVEFTFDKKIYLTHYGVLNILRYIEPTGSIFLENERRITDKLTYCDEIDFKVFLEKALTRGNEVKEINNFCFFTKYAYFNETFKILEVLSTLPILLQARGLIVESFWVFLFVIFCDFFKHVIRRYYKNVFHKIANFVKLKIFKQYTSLYDFFGLFSSEWLYCDTNRKMSYMSNDKDIFEIRQFARFNSPMDYDFVEAQEKDYDFPTDKDLESLIRDGEVHMSPVFATKSAGVCTLRLNKPHFVSSEMVKNKLLDHYKIFKKGEEQTIEFCEEIVNSLLIRKRIFKCPKFFKNSEWKLYTAEFSQILKINGYKGLACVSKKIPKIESKGDFKCPADLNKEQEDSITEPKNKAKKEKKKKKNSNDDLSFEERIKILMAAESKCKDIRKKSELQLKISELIIGSTEKKKEERGDKLSLNEFRKKYINDIKKSKSIENDGLKAPYTRNLNFKVGYLEVLMKPIDRVEGRREIGVEEIKPKNVLKEFKELKREGFRSKSLDDYYCQSIDIVRDKDEDKKSYKERVKEGEKKMMEQAVDEFRLYKNRSKILYERYEKSPAHVELSIKNYDTIISKNYYDILNLYFEDEPINDESTKEILGKRVEFFKDKGNVKDFLNKCMPDRIKKKKIQKMIGCEKIVNSLVQKIDDKLKKDLKVKLKDMIELNRECSFCSHRMEVRIKRNLIGCIFGIRILEKYNLRGGWESGVNFNSISKSNYNSIKSTNIIFK